MKLLLDAGFSISIMRERIAPKLGAYRVSFLKDQLEPAKRTTRRKWKSININDPSNLEDAAQIAIPHLLPMETTP